MPAISTVAQGSGELPGRSRSASALRRERQKSADRRGHQHKGSDLASLDPETGLLTSLFNPRLDDWPTHFASEGGVIIPRTPSARVTVRLLRLNLPVRVEVREELVSLGRWPRTPHAP